MSDIVCIETEIVPDRVWEIWIRRGSIFLYIFEFELFAHFEHIVLDSEIPLFPYDSWFECTFCILFRLEDSIIEFLLSRRPYSRYSQSTRDISPITVDLDTKIYQQEI